MKYTLRYIILLPYLTLIPYRHFVAWIYLLIDTYADTCRENSVEQEIRICNIYIQSVYNSRMEEDRQQAASVIHNFKCKTSGINIGVFVCGKKAYVMSNLC